MKPYGTPVWERARGRWDEIFAALASHELSAAMKKPGTHVACPVHGGKHKDAFRLFRDFAEEGTGVCNTCGKFGSGIKLLAWLKGWTNAETAAEVDAYLSGNPRESYPVRPVAVPKTDYKGDEFKMKLLLDAWENAVGLGHPDAEPARIYLDRRGLTPMEGPLPDIRFHPSLDYWHDGKCLGRFPAIVSLVRQSDGQVATIHRTYLQPGGFKASVPEVKKLMQVPSIRSMSGAAIRLDDAIGWILHIAEGLETALAVRNVTREPTWCTVSSTLMTSLAPPSHVRAVCIWADRDPSTANGLRPGQDAANKTLLALKERGVSCVILMPPPIGQPSETVDWNDVVDRYGADAVRSWPCLHEARKALSQHTRRWWRRRAS